MKKIYLLAFSAILVSSSFAQTAKKKNFNSDAKTKNIATARVKAAPNQINATLWSDDFSNAANWASTDNSGEAVPQAWVIGAGGLVNAATTVMTSTSGADYALFDSDGYGNGTTNNADLTLVTPITSLVGHANVRLVFEQYYGKFDDVTTVSVSNDGGTTWIPFVVNSAYANDAFSTNPEVVTVDISSAAGNQASVLLRFNYTGAWGYFWFIDDLKIEDVPSLDASITAVTVPNPDCDLSAAEQVSVTVSNNGAAAITGFQLSYNVNGAGTVTETYSGSIAAGATANYTFTGTANLSTPSILYTIATAVTLTGDATPANDVDTAYTVKLVPTVDTYTNDFEDPNAPLLGVALEGNNPAAWYFSGNNHTTGGGASLAFNNGGGITTNVNEYVFTPCIDLTPGNIYFVEYWANVPSATTTTLTCGATVETRIGSDNLPASATTLIGTYTIPSTQTAYTLTHQTFTVATAGTYNIGFRAQLSGTNVPWFRLDDINVGIESPIAVKESLNSDVVSIFPNPSAGIFTVKATENNSSVAVYSIIGENVYSAKLAKGNNAIDLSNVAAGSYIVKINNGGTLVTKRVVINK